MIFLNGQFFENDMSMNFYLNRKGTNGVARTITA